MHQRARLRFKMVSVHKMYAAKKYKPFYIHLLSAEFVFVAAADLLDLNIKGVLSSCEHVG